MVSDRQSDDGAMLALLRASATVRDGRWINGAPTHVLSELLNALETDGWALRKLPCPECHGRGRVQKTETTTTRMGGFRQWSVISFERCPRGCPDTTAVKL